MLQMPGEMPAYSALDAPLLSAICWHSGRQRSFALGAGLALGTGFPCKPAILHASVFASALVTDVLGLRKFNAKCKSTTKALGSNISWGLLVRRCDAEDFADSGRALQT